MTDPVDLDDLDYRLGLYPESLSPQVIQAALDATAELRTARTERDAAQMKYAMTDGALTLAQDERLALAARIEAAKAIHYPTFNPHSSTGEECDCCGQDWPCETVSALSGATEPAAGADLPIEFDLDSVAEALPPFDPSVERVAGPRLIPCPRCGRDRWAPADWDGESIDALVAELRTARACNEAASALCDAADAQVHDHFGGDGSMVNAAHIRAALSGATEPAGESLGKFKARRPS